MIQNPGDGLSPPRKAAKTAVASGSTQTSTAPWAAGTLRMAIDVSHGKPTMQPADTIANGASAARGGKGARFQYIQPAASSAATSPRPNATKAGSKVPTAMRVNGNVRLKMATPIRPSSMPADSSDRPVRVGMAFCRGTLVLIVVPVKWLVVLVYAAPRWLPAVSSPCATSTRRNKSASTLAPVSDRP